MPDRRAEAAPGGGSAPQAPWTDITSRRFRDPTTPRRRSPNRRRTGRYVVVEDRLPAALRHDGVRRGAKLAWQDPLLEGEVGSEIERRVVRDPDVLAPALEPRAVSASHVSATGASRWPNQPALVELFMNGPSWAPTRSRRATSRPGPAGSSGPVHPPGRAGIARAASTVGHPGHVADGMVNQILAPSSVMIPRQASAIALFRWIVKCPDRDGIWPLRRPIPRGRVSR